MEQLVLVYVANDADAESACRKVIKAITIPDDSMVKLTPLEYDAFCDPLRVQRIIKEHNNG